MPTSHSRSPSPRRKKRLRKHPPTEYATPRPAKPYIAGLDGIDLKNDDNVLPRLELQNQIFEHQHKRLLVSSPPASGKTSILQLLRQNLKEVGKKLFLLQSAPPTDEPVREYLKRELGIALKSIRAKGSRNKTKTYDQILDSSLESFDFVFVDDAQRWYKTSLVEDLVKRPGSSCRVVLFASYSQEDFDQRTPAVPGRLHWNDFTLSHEKQVEFCNYYVKWAREKSNWDDQLKEWLESTLPMVRSDTGGHVGLLRLFIQELVLGSRDPKVVGGAQSLKTATTRFYFGSIFESIVARRLGFINTNLTDHTMQRILQQLLEGITASPPPPINQASDEEISADDKAKRKLLRAVVLVGVPDPKTRTSRSCSSLRPFIIATGCVRRIRARFDQLFGSKVNGNIDEWLRFLIQCFNGRTMANTNSHGTGSHKIPLEWTLQHEFWRSASMTLPPRKRVAAEVSKVMEADRTRSTDSKTRLDFWVNSDLNWAVELVHQGNKAAIEDHLSRFQKDGSYYNLEPVNWRVIDFRAPTMTDRIVEPVRHEGLITVVCRTDYSGATVYFGKSKCSESLDFLGKVVARSEQIKT